MRSLSRFASRCVLRSRASERLAVSALMIGLLGLWAGPLAGSAAGDSPATQFATSTLVTSAANPSAFGDSVKFTATVTAVGTGATPTGSVEFFVDDGSTPMGTSVIDPGCGCAQFTTSSLAAGAHTVTATYGGDNNFLASISLPLTQTVNQAPTTTSLQGDDFSVFGNSVTFTATVTAVGTGTPTGSVELVDNDVPLVTTVLDPVCGCAQLTTSSLAAGTHAITATYGGDNNFTGSTSSNFTSSNAPLILDVAQAPTAMSVTSAPNPSVFGQSVGFTATISAVGTGTPTGSVEFFVDNGATPVGTSVIASGCGCAQFATSSLGAGAHTVTATYAGDNNFLAAISPPLTQAVNQAPTTTSVTSAPSASVFGQSVTFTATVTAVGTGATPTGSVQFSDSDGPPLGTSVIDSGCGCAQLTTSSLAAGIHAITATYGGDNNFTGSISPPLTQTVLIADTAMSVTSAPNPSVLGQSVKFTATVAAIGTGATPTGSVQFFVDNGATPIGTSAIDSGCGCAQFATSSLAAGTHTITATYEGDDNFAGSTRSESQTVQTPTTTSVTSAPSASVFGQSVTFTATVTAVGTGATPTGSVQFSDSDGPPLGTSVIDSGCGCAQLTTSSLAAGIHAITATYGGDNNFTGSISPPLTQTVLIADTAMSVTSAPNPSVLGQSVKFTATVAAIGTGATPTGSVQFFVDNGATPIGTSAIDSGCGCAQFATSSLAAGTHTITATYEGDDNFAGSTRSESQTVQTPTTTSVTSAPSASVFGQSVTFTATVTAVGTGATPTGSVQFSDSDGPPLGTSVIDSGCGCAQLTTSSLAAGIHAITATYGGDNNFTGSISPPLTQTVLIADTAMSVTSAPNPSVLGQSVKFTATVAAIGTGATPTGSVQFFVDNGATPIGTSAIDSGCGCAQFATSSLAAGTHTITATYEGDDNFAGSTNQTLTQTVDPAPQTIAFPTTPVTYGQPDYSPASASSGLAVSYTSPSGACAVDRHGLLQITGAGNCTVTANQGGDGDYQPAAPVTQTFAVAKAPLTVDANPASTVFGQAPALSATPHGFVNGDTAASAGITGKAACTVASGTSTDVGSYPGAISCVPGNLSSANYSFVGGAHATLTITPASQAITLSSTPPATPLLGGTYTVASSGGGSGNPVVISVDGSSTSGACTVAGAVVSFRGLGTCVIDTNQAATHDYSAAPQRQQTFVIEQPTTTTVSSSANPSISGQSITLTATVAGPAGSGHVPAGTVKFEDGSATLGTATLSNGTATLTISMLSQATHAITVVYAGDTLDQSSTSSSLSQQVLAANAGGLIAETTAFVESSAKFQALPQKTQQAVSTILNGVSSALASFTPTLSPAQLKVLVKAYDAAVTLLENQGYLTAAQASILDGAAGDFT